MCETKIPSLKWDLDNERNAILRYVEFKIYQGHIKDAHLRRGKISNFIIFFFHFFSDLLWTHTRYKMLSTYVDIFPLRIPVYAFTCIYPLLYQDCIVVRKSVKTSFFFLLSVIWTNIRCTAQRIFVSDVFEHSFEENCLWLIILFNIDSFCKCL